MPSINLTPGQRMAVAARGTSILVSAAAGSGKTRVLTERLMSYVTDAEDPRDIDSFLIITYTRAAAAELRSRILDELGRRVAEDPENRRLRAQATLCYRAQIGTIHSFCTSLIRENAHLLGVTPDFKVLDEDRAQTIKTGVLDRLLDAAYARIETDAGFRSLVDTVGAGRDDQRLVRVTLSLHGRMQSHAYPEDWAARQAQALDLQSGLDAGDTAWGAALLEKAKLDAEYWSAQMEDLLRTISEDELLRRAYGDSLTETAAAIRALRRAMDGGWDAALAALPVPFPRLKALRNPPEATAALAEAVKARREACKKAMETIAELLDAPSSALLADMARTRPAMEALLRLATDFDAAYSREKRRQGVLDFSDLEHMAVRLLLDKATGEPTWLAVELSQRYTEIMVDEYQDVNAVQDRIFSAVSRQGRNLFLVGDVKQSIYRFRLADPGIFIDKYLHYQDAAEPGAAPEDALLLPEAPPRRVLLQENFRSRAAVLDAANHVFGNIMSARLGEIDYDARARLRAGAVYPPEGEVPAELCVFGLPETAADGETPDKTALEAAAVAEKIAALVASGAPVTDGGALRPMRYGDIVILLRSPNAAGPAFRRALEARGIPVSAEQGGGFFTSVEVALMTSLLAVIDNPHQDVPLISVLRSPAFGFTADDLAEVRACDREGDFFTALTRAAEQGKSACRAFLDLLSELRALAPDLAMDALVWHIYNRTALLAVCRALGDGETRRENLVLLFELARKFEETGHHGVHRFTAWLGRLAERGEEPAACRTGSGAVRILSIHKSKGLEFPVVFLCDTARRFNRQDLNENVLVHPALGLGPKVMDLERGVEYPTLARRAIARRLTLESLSEEMRVLYVAMTRARERLILTCAVKEPERLLQKLGQDLASPVAPQVLETAQSMAHWLIQAALLPGCAHLKLTVQPLQPQETGEQAEPPAPADVAALGGESPRDMARRLEFVYPHEAETALPSKLTATELKGLPGEAEGREESAALTPGELPSFEMPDLVPAAPGPLTGAQRGTVTHLVMQYIDYARTGSAAEVRGEVARMAAQGRLTQQEAEAVDAGTIAAFFRSEIGRRILRADSVLREFRFSLLCPAANYFQVDSQDEVLLQGVVDCCIEEHGELTIIDYKTDYVNQKTLHERAARYAPQLRAYAAAMARITGKPVRQGVLYFLRAGMAVETALDAKNIL